MKTNGRMRSRLSVFAILFLSSSVAWGNAPGEGEEDPFVFSHVSKKDHPHMHRLLANAMRYADPRHELIDPASGYPVEGWNQDPERKLFLRSFTQLTAIGEWAELLANIAAGHADNPYLSREVSLEKLTVLVETLLRDQEDPGMSSMGLLGNFLGFAGDRRVGPMAREVTRASFVEAFGEEKAAAIWKALLKKEWIILQKKGTEGEVKRGKGYGGTYFTGPMKPFSDEATRERIMELLDQRVVMVIYGDNANLAVSLAKSIGAILPLAEAGDATAAEVIGKMESFLEAQKEGYELLFDKEVGLFRFGWNDTQKRYYGWDDGNGGWVVGYSDYLVNEFRGPCTFVVIRYGLPADPLANLGFKIRSYVMPEGERLHTLAPWEGSAFQALGLGISMLESDHPSWRRILGNFVKIALDHSSRHDLPGFLSESYTGEETAYTGDVGIPELTVSSNPRITDAASIYTLGNAYMIDPDGVERLLAKHEAVLSRIRSEHGPWEGYNVGSGEVIRFQTTAHLLSFILGAIGTSSENMERYLRSRDLADRLASLQASGKPVELLGEGAEVLPWTADGSRMELLREGAGCRMKGDAVAEGGLSLPSPEESGWNLSGGDLVLQYRSAANMEITIRLDRKKEGARLIPSEVFTVLEKTGEEPGELRIPLPPVPGMHDVREVALLFGQRGRNIPIDFSLVRFQFSPHQEGSK